MITKRSELCLRSEGQKVHGADQKKLDEANVMYKALDNFYNNAKNLNDFNSNGYIPEAEDVQVTLDDVGSFKDFLVGGKGMTNYQRLDEAADKKGNKIDEAKLSEKLGCPVIKTVSTSETGIKEAVSAAAALEGKGQKAPYHQGEIDIESKAAVEAADRKRFDFVNGIVKDVEVRKTLTKDKTKGDAIDKVVTNPILGLLIFAAIMFVVFYISQTTVGTWLADILVGWIETFQEWAGEQLGGSPSLGDVADSFPAVVRPVPYGIPDHAEGDEHDKGQDRYYDNLDYQVLPDGIVLFHDKISIILRKENKSFPFSQIIRLFSAPQRSKSFRNRFYTPNTRNIATRQLWQIY